MQALPPGSVVELDADILRGKTLPELKKLAQELGISLAGLEDRTSAVYTRLMQHASSVEIEEPKQ